MLFTKDGVRALHSWTHASLGRLIAHAAAVPPGLLLTEMDGFGRSCIRDQLIHVISCEDAWICGLQNLPPVDWLPAEYRTAASVMDVRRRVMAGTLEYLDALSDSQLNTELKRYPKEWVGPPRGPAFILHHVLTHSFHHKGQVVAMFRLLGHPAPDTDLQRQET